MEKLIKDFILMKKRKKGKIFIAVGMALLILSAILMVSCDTIFTTVAFFFSVCFNIVGLYIVLWVKDGGEEGNGKR